MLALAHVSAGYGRRHVLQDVTWNVAPGEFVGLIGPNGCGKTTLLRVLSGVLPMTAGEVRVRGTPLREIDRRQLARTLACLLQDLSLELAFTVRELVLLGRSPHLPRFGGEAPRDLQIAQQAMELADVSHLADRRVTELSGGERQRVLIAMCLAQEPQVLLLDEPTSHLDIGHQLSLLDLIAKLNRTTGVTVVAVLHDLNLAAEYCRRLLVLEQGRVAALGTPEEVLTPETIRRVYGVTVRVERNPLSGRPHVVLTAGAHASG
jgi:iron complex transport system ATP-binding protein